MIRRQFTEQELSTITNALSIAAEKFDEYVSTLEHTRLRDQFARQAEQSRELIMLLTMSDTVVAVAE